MRVEERLLKYVSYWTTSDEECRQIPSSERQFELGKVLEQELRDLGLEKVTLTDHCYVYGLLPATKGYAVGFISHMDTAPDFSGKDVKPQIIPDYDGNDVLLKGSGAYLKVSDFPTLKTLKGRTLITTDGTTLLGADDKAGVSEIMTAVEQIITEKIMINAALVGCEIASLLPENETPAHTEGREGFYHLTDFSGDIAHAKVNYIVRDHDKATFEKRLDTLRGIEKKMNEKYHADTVKLNIQHSYSNMLEVIEKNEYVVAIAKKAIKNVGLEPVSRPVRGGTDGARLSFMGLPCPNLGTGGYGFHGPFEHISVEGMDTAVSVIKEIVKITAE